MLQAIATDLDGTFLDATHTVSPRNEAAARAAIEAGVSFIVATGRPTRWIWPLKPLLALGCPIVASNGAMTIDPSGRVLERHAIPADLVSEVISLVGSQIPGTRFALESGDTWAREPSFGRHLPDDDADVIAPAAELPTGEALKLLVWADNIDSKTLHAAVNALVGDRVTCTYSYLSSDGLLELSALGVTKATAVASILAAKGIGAKDLAAFGDMPNDVEMLRLAGRGMIPANAHPDLLSLGFEVVGNHAADGVGIAIEELLANR